MVRVVGGTIHNAVPATANITRTARHGPFAVPKKGESSYEVSLGSSEPSSSKHRQSAPMVFSPKPVKHGLPPHLETERQNGPTLPGIDPDLKFGAKPSEIRAAAKQNRDKARQEQSRKDKVRQREAEAALRMKTIKDEINTIKEKEREQDQEAIAEVLRERSNYTTSQADAAALESVNHCSTLDNKQAESTVPPDLTTCEESLASTRAPFAPERKRSKAGEDEAVSRGYKELALEEMMAEQSSARHVKKKEENLVHLLGEKTRIEMEALYMDMPMDELNDLKQQYRNLPVSTATVAASPAPPARKQLEATQSGKLRKAPSRRGLERTASNRVPEMRRRANQRDLLYDDDDRDLKTWNSGGTVEAGKQTMEKWEATRQVISIVDSTASKSDEGTGTEKATDKEAPKTKPRSSMVAMREARDAAKVEEERRIKQEQKAELDKAKEHFNKGHDLCWKGNNSAAALVDYRKALFTRESVLGKYHEETGRSYFWIGKSLTKLRDYEEALMAFSRSMRIFQRVLRQNNKYNIWAVTAVESVFRQMDDPSTNFANYKASLEASIRREQSGDQLRKKGKLAEAIAEYREAIEHLEEYHPDAADLYCKIAIILRQQGEFDRALEEYQYASEIYELSLGAEHPETVKTLNQLIEKKRLNQKSLALMEKLNMRTKS